MPEFAVVKDIIMYDTMQCLFITELLDADVFNSHYHSYEVSVLHPPQFVASWQIDFKDHHVLHHYEISSEPNLLFIPLKYHVIENV